MSTPIGAVRRLRRPASAGAALLISAVLLTACGSDDDQPPATPATNPAPAASGGQLRAQLTPLADCLRTHGVDLPDQPNRKQVQEAFKNTDVAAREKARAACRSLAPSGLRDLIDARPS
jgi:hypothetical protein